LAFTPDFPYGVVNWQTKAVNSSGRCSFLLHANNRRKIPPHLGSVVEVDPDEAEVWGHRRRSADESKMRLRFGQLEGEAAQRPVSSVVRGAVHTNIEAGPERHDSQGRPLPMLSQF
jgi:hypothetical protein